MAGCLQHHFTKKGRPQQPLHPCRAAEDAGGQICINEQSFDAIDDIFASRLAAGPPGPWAQGFRYNGGLPMGSWGTKIPHLDDFWGSRGRDKKGHDNGGYPNEFFAESNLKYHEHTHCT